jgi:GTPase
MHRDLKITLVGNVDAGKSSIIGVLTRGILDDGNGLARSFILKHDHEQLRGQTSSIGTELVGFDINGKHITPTNPNKDRRLKEYKEVSAKSHTRIVLIDLCGHKKYLKTTLNGLCGHSPDYSMIIISANSGNVPKMTLEHINTCYSLKVPFFIVVTKIDMVPDNIYQETLKKIDEFVLRYKKRFNSEVNIQIFKVSNKTGEGINELLDHIKSLSKNLPPVELDKDEKIEYIIDNVYQVPDVGIVVGGFLRSGTIKEKQTLLLGPNSSGEFEKIQIRSIHVQCIPTNELFKYQQSTIAIKFIKKPQNNSIRKGSKIFKDIPDGITDEFDATVKILKHSTGIHEGYESVIHMENITQTAKVIKIYEETIQPKLGSIENGVANNVLRMGSTGKIRLKFIKNKEHVKIGTLFIFREGNCRGVGTVTDL